MKKTSATVAALAEKAKTLGRHKSRKAAVIAALTEYVQRRKQREIIELFGTIDYDPAYNYKQERTAKKI